MSNSKISIIMAAYNAEKTIRQAIESVLLQTYQNFELIIVDDCSVDRTCYIVEEYVRKDNRIHLLSNSKNMGVSYTRFCALNVASGEWIAVLDSDDAWMPEKLAKQMELQKRTNAVLLYTGSMFINDQGKVINWVLKVPEKVSYRQLLKQNILSNSSSLCRKDIYEKFYANGDGMHEDFALWLSILKDGETAYGVNEPLLIYRFSKKSKTSNKLKAAKMNWRTYRYVGLNRVTASYYMCWYILKSVLKYMHMK